jgi:hypothetical protein
MGTVVPLDAAPVIPEEALELHTYVVPTVDDETEILVKAPEQIVLLLALATGHCAKVKLLDKKNKKRIQKVIFFITVRFRVEIQDTIK